MSLDATRWAWAQPLRGFEKFTLLALADRANDQAECWPSLGALARDCGISRSTLKRCLENLEKAGYLTRRPPSAHHRRTQTTRYQLQIKRVEFDSPVEAEDDDLLGSHRPYSRATQNPQGVHTDPTVGPHRTLTRSTVNPKPIIEPIIEPTNEPLLGQNDPEDPFGSLVETDINTNTKAVNVTPTHGRAFDLFWQAYPKKRKKKTAHDLWQRKRLGDQLDTILMDIRNRQQYDVYWQDGYVPDPTTYLSQERWEDDIITRRVARTGRKSGAEILAEGCRSAFDRDWH